MKPIVFRNIAALVAGCLFLSACNGSASTPTVNPADIATSAVQTVEARYTEQAAQSTPTAPSAPTLANTPTLRPAPPTSTPQPLDSNGKPCYKAIFLADVTIPDGMIVAPGSTFTKKWRVLNDGNCTWDRSYSLMLASGDAMGTVLNVPLTEVISPGATADLSVDLTAPTANGLYTGYWRIATPFGGTFGVGIQDQSLIVEINVTDKPNRDAGVSKIDVGLFGRVPEKGCNSRGAAYTFSAVITANSAINIDYHWSRHPDDGSKPEGGRVNFTAPGSKTVTFTWNLQKEAVQGIDRWVALVIDEAVQQTSQRIHFTFTCDQ
jgi:hypothetical protein